MYPLYPILSLVTAMTPIDMLYAVVVECAPRHQAAESGVRLRSWWGAERATRLTGIAAVGRGSW